MSTINKVSFHSNLDKEFSNYGSFAKRDEDLKSFFTSLFKEFIIKYT